MGKEDKIHVKDKAKYNHSYYCKDFYVLDIEVVNGCKFNSWTLSSKTHNYNGNTIDELIEILNCLKANHNLDVYNDTSKDILIIYIDELNKIRGYFNNLITYDGKSYVQLFDNIEFRSYTDWTKDKNVIEVMDDWFNTFIDEKYFYLTTSQYMRKRINRVMKGKAKDIYPSFDEYNYFMDCISGGVLYCPINELNHKMKSYDICSAYIYGLIFKKHCCTKPVLTDCNTWNSYLDSEYEGSIGTYEIEYYCPVSTISCYKDINKQNLKSGQHKVTITLTNIDLRLLFNMRYMNIINCTCKLLYTFKLDYLPEEFRQLCIDIFIKKLHTDKNSIAYKNIKVLLNGGFFGNLILQNVQRAYDDEYKKSHDTRKANQAAQAKYNDNYKNAATSPIWGIFTMSYARELVLTLGDNISGWRYSDTDSIYCDDTIDNDDNIDIFNQKIYNQNVKLCEKFNYDTEIAILGTFEFEHDIKYFRVWGNKTYGFVTIDNKVIIKAAGSNKEELNVTPETLMQKDFKPKYDNRLIKTCDENGYYEARTRGGVALLKSIMMIR